MSKTPTLSRMLPAIWMALSFPFVNGTFITSDPGICSQNEFWYEPIRGCIPLGKQSFQSAPPHAIACPLGGSWYWSSQVSACLPASPVPEALSVSCPMQYTWNPAASRCAYIQSSVACGTTEFWFSERATCLARRSSTPPHARCPSGWYWSARLSSCAPANPEVLLSVTCGNESVWSPSALICQRAVFPSRRSPSSTPSQRPSPSPSAGHSRRHSLKSRTHSLCPAGLDACPVLKAGDLSDFECVDPRYDLHHCGGCSMDGRGKDCTLIKGVWNVECMQARCSVLTCAAGYIPSPDRKTCTKL